MTHLSCNDNLQFHQLSQVRHSGGNVLCFKITFHNYKHSYNQRPVTLNILPSKVSSPVQFLLAYLSLRDASPGPLWPVYLQCNVHISFHCCPLS